MNIHEVRTLPNNPAGSYQVLYRLEPPQWVSNVWDEPAVEIEYIVVSAVNAFFSGPETYIFPADADGEITSWSELPGSYRGGFEHKVALTGFQVALDRKALEA